MLKRIVPCRVVCRSVCQRKEVMGRRARVRASASVRYNEQAQWMDVPLLPCWPRSRRCTGRRVRWTDTRTAVTTEGMYGMDA